MHNDFGYIYEANFSKLLRTIELLLAKNRRLFQVLERAFSSKRERIKATASSHKKQI